MTDGEKREMKEIVDRAASQLSEHFDSVLILVTKNTEDGNGNTAGYEAGRGNFYAQLGQVREWLAMQDQYQRNEANRRDREDGE